MTPNDSSRKVGKSREQKIEITVLNVNVKVLSNFLNPAKRAKSKNSHYSPILQG